MAPETAPCFAERLLAGGAVGCRGWLRVRRLRSGGALVPVRLMTDGMQPHISRLSRPVSRDTTDNLSTGLTPRWAI